ncbi:MAG: asparagine synthase-related protein [Gammaproteobacteria bacterium]
MSSPPESLRIEIRGRLHNLADLKACLGPLDTNEVAADPVGAVLSAGWRRWGEALAEHLVGDYALALRDERRSLTYLVRNPVGAKPLFYRVDDGRLSHGFSLPELRERCPLPVTPDMDWAAAYLLRLSFSPTETGYREIHKLAPGHWLRCDASGQVTIRRYHHWRDDAPDARRRDPRWVEAYREVFEEAIRCRMEAHAPMATENSGGIDSGSVTAYLAHFLGDPGDRLLSVGAALETLEPAYILETSQSLGIRHNYLLTDHHGPRDESARAAAAFAALGYPEEIGMAGANIPFYEECRLRGIGVLFSGFGGDETVSNHGNHLRWELLDRRRYPALWDVLPGNPLARSLRLLKLLTVGRGRRGRNSTLQGAKSKLWETQILRTEVVERLKLYERLMEAAIYDAPYRRVNDLVLHYHLQRMEIASRLEDCTALAAAYGVDYRWPLLDARLIQQYLSTPSIEKLGPGGLGRYLHRRAISGVVPGRVAWKPSKDMGYAERARRMCGAPIARTASEARALAASLHPELAEMIDPARLDSLIARAEQGDVDVGFAVMFQREVRLLRNLDTWLRA